MRTKKPINKEIASQITRKASDRSEVVAAPSHNEALSPSGGPDTTVAPAAKGRQTSPNGKAKNGNGSVSREVKELEREGLTIKEAKFAINYTRDFNGTQAAMDAGIGDTYGSCAAAATTLLKNSKIQEYIREVIQDQLAAAKITPEKIVRELGAIAFADPRAIFTQQGHLKRLDALTQDEAAAIAGIDVIDHYNEDGEIVRRTRKVKLHPKTKALKMLGERARMFQELQPQPSAEININQQFNHQENKMIVMDWEEFAERVGPERFDEIGQLLLNSGGGNT